MKLYNTLTKQIEEFVPYNKNKVTMYTCGPTVYHYAHIGNLRTYISEDILEKTLNYIGYSVERCMNITDVGHLVSDADNGEDKMNVAASREHKSVLEIANFYKEAFFKDIESLNIKKPTYISNATDNIDEYIKVIENLLENNYAYVSNGNVYFDTEKYNDYYRLSGRNKNEQLIAVRENVKEDKDKKNPNDFGLWFTNSKFNNQELKWNSPWGVGYPGWHIECSCISMKYLGEYLDIHCGAIDAIFPHHTNEIAQSECYLKHKWCNYWIHMEFLNDETGKMSKSKGDFLTLDLLNKKGYSPVVYRLFCLSSHYRKAIVFNYEILDSIKNIYEKLKRKIDIIKNNIDEVIDKEKIKDYEKKFKESLENDLNTSNALTVLYDVVKDNSLSNKSKLILIENFDKVLSLDLLQSKKIDKNLEEYIEQKIIERNNAKLEKDYKKSDLIRDELLEKGIIIKDTREGTIFEIR